ncbi:DUF1653 domain-containing protein [Butyrivibrio sp. INlla14]|uniref:DUF1653 domain-containing protein n=1 Tax=Butyrivibrio sp. INlla14 TaxID=1520808 RepID=UPI0008761394|nr:DUF1653 domain-containing protein [Butyrivibrio sp. INlla14]SCY45291.1 Protein of unknown function [Butyrivibrio sp. INlla14]
MNRPRPVPQELYRHFKNKLYQIISIAIHSETREEMVVYQALYGDYKVYVRPLDMFMSEVDHVKYPDVTQKYRFEKVEPGAVSLDKPVEVAKDKTDIVNRPQDDENIVKPQQDISVGPVTETTEKLHIATEREKFRKEPYKHSQVMDKSVDEEAQELNLDPLVIEFMDADLAADKNDILSKLRPTITNEMIDIMALSLGVVVNEGDVYDRYNDLRTCLNTMEKFESTRLR